MDSGTAAAYRKIELQSPEDFAYLVDNVRRAAAESVDAAFPPVDDGDGDGGAPKDDLHLRIEELVNEVSLLFFHIKEKYINPLHHHVCYEVKKMLTRRQRNCSTSGRPSPWPRPT